MAGAHRCAVPLGARDRRSVGRLLRGPGIELTERSDAQLGEIDARLTPDVRSVLSVGGALRARSAIGGTAPDRVAEQLAALADAVHDQVAWANGADVRG
jgi:argininosuccinate lyase